MHAESVLSQPARFEYNKKTEKQLMSDVSQV